MNRGGGGGERSENVRDWKKSTPLGLIVVAS